MTQLWCSTRFTLAAALLVFAAGTLSPARSRADMPDATSLVDYGFKGFTLGVELGLAVGYITTGPRWEDDEWKKLVIGMGIGAIGGITSGIMLAVIDSTSHGVPAGYYLIRDAGFGTLLGAVMGGAIGVLLWVDDGTSKDVLKGAAWGAVFGAGAGLLYGLIESANARPGRHSRDDDDDDDRGFRLGHDVHLSVAPVPPVMGQGMGMTAVVSGRLDL
jgi:hypothetical protein